MFLNKKERMFIYFNWCIKKKIESPKSKENIIMFAKKLAPRQNYDINSKSKNVNIISKIIKKVIVFIKNLNGGQ